MEVTVEALTGLPLVHELLEGAYGIDSTMDRRLLYRRGHSIQRAMLFHVTLKGIPSFVSVHLVRHSSTGQSHLVSSNRDDWTGRKPEEVHRLTPVTHQMILNAEHLRDMSAKRLCGASHKETVEVMRLIKNAVAQLDPDLANWMVPKCWHTGWCDEAKPCESKKGMAAFRLWRSHDRLQDSKIT